MAIKLPTKCELTDRRTDEIAHAIAEHYMAQQFRLMQSGDYRRKLGTAAQDLKNGITPEELHQFVLQKLTKGLGRMFDWMSCGITGEGGY